MNLYALYVQSTLVRDWSHYRSLGLRDAFLGSWEPGFGDAVGAAEAAGLRVHGWISPGHLIRAQRPDLCIDLGNSLWPDWRLLEVREMARDLVAQMVYEHNVAPNLDYVRWMWDRLATPGVPEWSSAEPITETVTLIREATEGYHLSTSGVSWIDGQLGNGQDWPAWGASGLVDAVLPMIYQPAFDHYLDHWIDAVGADADWFQPAISFWNLDDTPNVPYTLAELEHRLARLPHGCGFFDASLLEAHPEQVQVKQLLAQYAPKESEMDVIDHLLAAEEMLRAANLEAEANQVADLIASLRARDDVLDAQADVIEDD